MSNVVEEEPLEDENSIKEGSYFSINKKKDIEKNSGTYTYNEEEIVKDSLSHNGINSNYRSNNIGLGMINTGIKQAI
jgi:hypothetical protein